MYFNMLTLTAKKNSKKVCTPKISNVGKWSSQKNYFHLRLIMQHKVWKVCTASLNKNKKNNKENLSTKVHLLVFAELQTLIFALRFSLSNSLPKVKSSSGSFYLCDWCLTGTPRTLTTGQRRVSLVGCHRAYPTMHCSPADWPQLSSLSWHPDCCW